MTDNVSSFGACLCGIPLTGQTPFDVCPLCHPNGIALGYAGPVRWRVCAEHAAHRQNCPTCGQAYPQ